MFAKIFKGAPMGNRNAAKDHQGGAMQDKASEVPASDIARIASEHANLKSKSTKDLLKLHQGLSKVRGSYTAGEMGGKQGLIDGILQHRHGEKRVSAFYNQPKAKKSDLEMTLGVGSK